MNAGGQDDAQPEQNGAQVMATNVVPQASSKMTVNAHSRQILGEASNPLRD